MGNCHGFGVGWEEPNAPIIDPAPPRTVTDNGDDSYNTNDKIVDVDDSYNTNDKIVDDSYNTNEKIVEAEDSYNTNDKIVDVEDSYNTNEKLVETGDSYNTNDNTNQKIVEESAPVTCGTPPAAKITKENGANYDDVVDLREDDKVEEGIKPY